MSHDELQKVLFPVRSRVFYRIPALDLIEGSWFPPRATLEDFLRATIQFFHTPATTPQIQSAVKRCPELKEDIEQLGCEYQVLIGYSQGELVRLVKVHGGTYELELGPI